MTEGSSSILGSKFNAFDSTAGPKFRRRSLPDFGDDVLLRIFSRMDSTSLAYCSVVCCRWHHVISSSSNLWQTAYFARVGRVSAEEQEKDLNMLQTTGDVWKARCIEEEQRAGVLGLRSSRRWKAHAGRVTCCKRVMGLVASGSADQTVRVWSANTLSCLEQYEVPNKASVVQMDFDENKVIAAAGQEVFLWSRNSHRRLLRRIKVRMSTTSMSYLDSSVFVGCTDGTVRVFDIYSGSCSHIFRQHTDMVTDVVMNPGSQVIASAALDGRLQLFDSQSGLKIATFSNPAGRNGITCLHLALATNSLFAGSVTGDLFNVDLRQEKIVWKMRVSSNGLTCLDSPSYSSSAIAASGVDGLVRVFHTGSGQRMMTTSDIDKDLSRSVRSPVLSLGLGTSSLVTAHADSLMTIYSIR